MLRALLAKGSLNGVIFATDDVDATFEKIRAAGADVLQELIDQPYGVRDCAFRDPRATWCASPGDPRGEVSRPLRRRGAPTGRARWDYRSISVRSAAASASRVTTVIIPTGPVSHGT